MNKKGEIGPHIVYSIQFVAIDALIHQYLRPGGYTYDKANVPLRCLVCNFIELFVPVVLPANLLARLIKRLKPEGNLFSGPAPDIHGIITVFLLQVCATA